MQSDILLKIPPHGVLQHDDLAAAPQRIALTGVIAVIGCDGAGKSTLTGDLYASLCDDHVTKRLYLGQDSGNILQAVLSVPLIGPMLGRYLSRRSKRAHGRGDQPARPDALTALVVHLLSRWRYSKFRRMLALQRQGAIVIVDRYPQAEATGFYFDGPGLALADNMSRFVRWLAVREQKLYREMATYVPALLIRLNIDAETAYARKPDHRLKVLREKARVLPTLAFNAAPLLDLDATDPYAQVLRTATEAAKAALGRGETLH
jgi:thymidylate kinase